MTVLEVHLVYEVWRKSVKLEHFRLTFSRMWLGLYQKDTFAEMTVPGVPCQRDVYVPRAELEY